MKPETGQLINETEPFSRFTIRLGKEIGKLYLPDIKRNAIRVNQALFSHFFPECFIFICVNVTTLIIIP